MGRLRWTRLREAGAATASPALLRSQTDDPQDMDGDNDDDIRSSGPGDGDADDQPCTDCGATGIKGADLCPTCQGSGSVMKESTNGSYWLYSDDPEWEQLREASHPQWEEMSEAPRTFSSDVRKKYSGSGVAMGDGSYPIPDADALRRAIASYGRNATPSVKAHIIKRAGALGLTGKLPDGWSGSKEAEPFGGKKAPPFGGKDDKSKDSKSKDGDKGGDKSDDSKPPWLKNKESESSLTDRLEKLEDEAAHDRLILKAIREAKPTSMRATFSNPLRVKTSNGEEGYQITLISEGRGNSDDDQWYTKEAIREMCEAGVCEGMQAFGDHPTEDEEEQRPERSVKELIGTYHDVKFAESGNKGRAEGIFVPLTLDENHPRYGWVVTLAEAAARSKAPQPICGISLFGLSAGEDCDRPDGTFGRMVSMIRPQSGDVVTNAGAGGGFVRQLMESARALRQPIKKELNPMQALAYQNATREAAKRVREANSDEERTSALEALEKLEGESIDNAPDSIQALREAAPNLVQEIEELATKDDGETIEELRETNKKLSDTLGKFTDAVGITEALREAGIEDELELQHYAGMAQQRRLKEAGAIKKMVEVDKAILEKREKDAQERIREALNLSDYGDSEVEGVGSRMPAITIPDDGGVEELREAGLPIMTSDAE